MMQFLKKAITTAVLTVSLIASLASAKAQTTLTGDTTGDPTFIRPIATYDGQLGNDGISDVSAPYEVVTFTPTVTGRYRIRETANFDNFLLVYAGGFDPDQPLGGGLGNPSYVNLASNDDFPTVGVSGIAALQLTAGTTYSIVTTGAAATDFGAYTITIDLATVTGTTIGAPTYARATNPNEESQFTGIYPITTVKADAGFRYAVVPITFSEAGLYRFNAEAVTNGYDLFITLYRGAFNPANAATNAVFANDDSPNTNAISSLVYGLEAGQTYTLVVSSYDTVAGRQPGEFFVNYTKIANPQTVYTGSTTGRQTLNLQNQFNPPITVVGNATRYRILRFDTTTAGVYFFKFFSTTPDFSAVVGTYEGPVTPEAIGANILDLELYGTQTNIVKTLYTFQRGYNLPANFSLFYLVSGIDNVDVGNFRVETYGPGVVAAVQVAYIRGAVTLKTFVDNPPAAPVTFPVTFTYRPTTGVDIVETFDLTSANGNFYANIPEGSYSLGIKTPRTLQKVFLGVDATDGIEIGLNALLVGADSNDDNFTDIRELLVLIAAYNKISPAAGYNAAADFNFDGANDITDLLIIIAFYNQQGQFLP